MERQVSKMPCKQLVSKSCLKPERGGGGMVGGGERVVAGGRGCLTGGREDEQERVGNARRIR